MSVINKCDFAIINNKIDDKMEYKFVWMNEWIDFNKNINSLFKNKKCKFCERFFEKNCLR